MPWTEIEEGGAGKRFSTSAGDFDIGARQTNGRHAHVEADVIVEHDPLGGGRTVLGQRLFFDADGRLVRALLVIFITAIPFAVLAVILFPLAPALASILILILHKITIPNEPARSLAHRDGWSPYLVLFVDLQSGSSGGCSGGGSLRSGVLLGGQVERFRLRQLGSGRAVAGRSGSLGQEPRSGGHSGGHISAHLTAQTVVNIPQVDARHVELCQRLVRRLTRRRIRTYTVGKDKQKNCQI